MRFEFLAFIHALDSILVQACESATVPCKAVSSPLRANARPSIYSVINAVLVGLSPDHEMGGIWSFLFGTAGRAVFVNGLTYRVVRRIGEGGDIDLIVALFSEMRDKNCFVQVFLSSFLCDGAMMVRAWRW